MANWLVGIATQIAVVSVVVFTALLLIGVAFLAVLHVCILGRVFRRFLIATSRGESSDLKANGGLSPTDLERIPCYDFGAGEKGSGGVLDCAVCLESFQTGERCRMLPICSHSFHAQCVDSWLMITPVCPICRTSACHRNAGGGSGILIGFSVNTADPSQLPAPSMD